MILKWSGKMEHKSQSKNQNHHLALDYLKLMELVPLEKLIQTMTLQTHKLHTPMSSAALHYSPPQDEHHHEDRPDLLGKRQEFYMQFMVPYFFQTSSGEPTILLYLVVVIEDQLS
ncbi:hypothetical protein Tco_0008052 [Tanacetum coccineum]